MSKLLTSIAVWVKEFQSDCILFALKPLVPVFIWCSFCYVIRRDIKQDPSPAADDVINCFYTPLFLSFMEWSTEAESFPHVETIMPRITLATLCFTFPRSSVPFFELGDQTRPEISLGLWLNEWTAWSKWNPVLYGGVCWAKNKKRGMWGQSNTPDIKPQPKEG